MDVLRLRGIFFVMWLVVFGGWGEMRIKNSTSALYLLWAGDKLSSDGCGWACVSVLSYAL